jgi:hypothetical protein
LNYQILHLAAYANQISFGAIAREPKLIMLMFITKKLKLQKQACKKRSTMQVVFNL